MAVKNMRKRFTVYGLGDDLIEVPPAPIVAQRAPTTNDFAEIGTVWIDQPNDDSYILTNVAANSATWINAGGGTGTFNALTVTTTASIGTNLSVGGTVSFTAFGRGMLRSSSAGAITAINGTNGQLIIGATGADAAWASVTSSDGSVVITGGANTLDLTVSGATASTFPTDGGTATPVLGATIIAGGTNITTAGAGQTVTINLDNNPSIAGGFTVTSGTTTITSNTNSAQAIYLHANGGAAETVQLHADQGTTASSVYLLSDVGGVTIEAGLATDDAINLVATNGGIDMDASLKIDIASSEAAVDAVRINASNAAGGIDIDDAGGGITIDSVGGYSIDSSSASNVGVSGAGVDLTLASAAGRVVINGEEAAADALRVVSAAGGLDLDVALQMNLTGSEAAADAIRMNASNAAGGIDIDAGTGGVAIDTTGAISLDAAAASNFTATGAFDVTIQSTAGSVLIDGGEAVADAINIDASDVAGGIDIDAGTGGIALDSTGAISIDAAAASNFTATGAFDITLSSTAGSMIVDGGEAAADAVQITASDAAGGVDINAGTGGITIDSGDAISLDGAAASNFTTSAGDVTIESTAASVNLVGGEAAADAISIQAASGGVDVDGALQINIASSQAAADAIRINASNAAGGIDIDDAGGGIAVDSAAGISIDAATASNFSAAAGDLTLAAATNSVNVTGAEAAADAVLISATNASGGITLDTGATPGVTMTNGTQTVQLLTGTGSPDGIVTGAQGSVYLRVNGTADTTLYVNTDGATAWTALTST